ncbi:unnamed protein product [Dicrocoelium dendriticum]|nr:unnamed protein product [Dicrocoelium dendriticum]
MPFVPRNWPLECYSLKRDLILLTLNMKYLVPHLTLSTDLNPIERDYLLNYLDPSAGLLSASHTDLPLSTSSDLGSWLRNILLSTNKNANTSATLRLCIQKGVF